MPRRLLVVDDEEHIRLPLARALVRLGYDVFLADDGAEALTQLGRIDVDAVISDVAMPVMTGIELAHAVVDAYPFLPLLFLTSSDVPPELLARPLVRLLRKPATARDVVEQLTELDAVLISSTSRSRRKSPISHPVDPGQATPKPAGSRARSPMDRS